MFRFQTINCSGAFFWALIYFVTKPAEKIERDLTGYSESAVERFVLAEFSQRRDSFVDGRMG